VSNYESLEVWKRAHQLTLDVYRITQSFPSSELYGLTSQLRRAAASIPANLAEGSGRGSDRELTRYCRIAAGSSSELEYHLLLASELGYVDSEDHIRLTQEVKGVRRMLMSLITHLVGDRRPATGDRRPSSADRRPATGDRRP
jgi:four helix bundle protein